MRNTREASRQYLCQPEKKYHFRSENMLSFMLFYKVFNQYYSTNNVEYAELQRSRDCEAHHQ